MSWVLLQTLSTLSLKVVFKNVNLKNWHFFCVFFYWIFFFLADGDLFTAVVVGLLLFTDLVDGVEEGHLETVQAKNK